MEIRLPFYDLIVELHEVVLEISGGKPGVLHDKLIHDAVHRPKNYQTYHDDYDIHTVCAVILDSISRSHAFVEGNKRTALLTMLYTYRANGVYLDFGLSMNKDYEDLVVWVVVNKPSIEEISAKLRTLTDRYTSSGVDALFEKLKSIFSGT